jgi:hypothetical protein
MAVRFGVFVPQGWRLDLVEIRDPVEQCEAMTAVAMVADVESGLESRFFTCGLRMTLAPYRCIQGEPAHM